MGTREYMWILKNYADTHTNMGMGKRQIFIERIRYGEAILILPALLTSLGTIGRTITKFC